MIGIVNTTIRENSFSLVVSKLVEDVLLEDNFTTEFYQLVDYGISEIYRGGFESELIANVGKFKKLIFVIPAYYKLPPPIFTDFINRLSKSQFEDFDKLPIMIISTQAGISIDSMPETIARGFICQAIRFNGFLSNITPNWLGVTPEWIEKNGTDTKFKDCILDFANNYQ